MKRRDFFKTPAIGLVLPGVAQLHDISFASELADEPYQYHPDIQKFPQRVHQDFITYTPGVEYFILGNGDTIAVLQYSPEQKGEHPLSFLGLTLMDAERFARKWSTYLFHPERGLENSMVRVSVDGLTHQARPDTFLSVDWKYPEKVPVVSLKWKAGQCEVEEEMFVPHEGGLLFRRLTIENKGSAACQAMVDLGLVPSYVIFDEIASDPAARTVNAHGYAKLKLQSTHSAVETSGRYGMTVSPGRIPPGGKDVVELVYSIRGDESLLAAKPVKTIWKETASYWKKKDLLSTGNKTLDHMYGVSRTGLKSLVARSGKRDSGFWMYNMEWVRDDVMVALGMLHAGFYEEARTQLVKILEKSVGEDGRTIESSRWFGYDYTELDQNGEVLYGIWAYLCWTGDEKLAKEYWPKIRAVGDFPLQDYFLDKKAGMVHNIREFWERRDSFGVKDGFELAYQFWVSIGLEKGAEVAERVGDPSTARRWKKAAAEIKEAFTSHPKYRLVENGHLIKRRTRDGEWQRYFIPPDRKGMPPGSPIGTLEKPECDPDTATALPIAFGMVDAKSDLARKTLAYIEQLWNQRWDFGGYSRYNTDSEPDPPAPWPFGSLFVARAYSEAGDSEKVWRVIRWLAGLHGGKAGSWFERYGPSITPPAPPVSVVGWNWAEMVMLITRHIMGVRPELDRFVVRPSLIEGVNKMQGRFTIRSHEVDVTVTRSTGEPQAVVNGKKKPLEDGLLSIPYPAKGKKLNIEVLV
jgi:hypothetical protein